MKRINRHDHGVDESFSSFPEKKYSVIYADPPWSYRDKAGAGQRGASFHYATTPLDTIKALPVHEISSDDCVLFLWATMPQLPVALSVIESWKFDFKTVAFTWVKKNKKKPTWFWGMGNWTRANAELCLLAVKGKPKRISASVHSVIDTPIEGHSKKPDVVRDRIVELMGDLPRIELYARGHAEGWDSWGNEVK